MTSSVKILERLQTLVVEDVMSVGAIEVDQEESLETCAAIMTERRVSGLPVVDGDRRCVGMLTAFDFVLAYAAARPSQRRAERSRVASADGRTVADRMTSTVQSVSKNTSLLDAARKMCDEHVHRLPVLDGSGRVAGIMTSLDIVAAVANAADEQSYSPNVSCSPGADHSQRRKGQR